MAFDTTKPPLPTNTSQESSGNLASSAISGATILSLLSQILAVLQALRLQQGTAYGLEIDPSNFDNLQ